MSQTWSAPEVAEMFKVAPTTVKDWAERVNVGEKTSAGPWRFSERDVQILEIVKGLREEGRGFNTITRRLSIHNSPSPVEESVPNADQSSPLDEDRIVGAVTLAIQQQNDLAEKYARAAHQIGRLEAEVEHLHVQLEGARSEIKLLKEPDLPTRVSWWRTMFGR